MSAAAKYLLPWHARSYKEMKSVLNNVSPDGLNLYTFVRNESVNQVDVLGLNKCDNKNNAQGSPPLGCTKWKLVVRLCCRTCIRDFPKEEGDRRLSSDWACVRMRLLKKSNFQINCS